MRLENLQWDGYIMKKTANADIRNLFRKFGGDTGSYQEIQQEYLIDKAQKNWPIVTAIEKERVSAPTLRAAANNAPRTSGSRTGSFAAYSEPRASGSGSFAAYPAAAKRPAEQPVEQASGSIAGIFAKQAAKPVAPQAAGLFAAMGGAGKAATPPMRALFGAGASGQAESIRPTQVNRPDDDRIASVFSRLLGQKNSAAAPDKSLRSMFGFLKK